MVFCVEALELGSPFPSTDSELHKWGSDETARGGEKLLSYRSLSAGPFRGFDMRSRDVFSKSDCFVRMSLPSATSEASSTKVVMNSNNPRWEESFQYEFLSGIKSILSLDIIDADLVQSDPIGSVLLDAESLSMDKKILRNFKFNEQGSRLEAQFLVEKSARTPCPVLTNDVLVARPCVEMDVTVCRVKNTTKEENGSWWFTKLFANTRAGAARGDPLRLQLTVPGSYEFQAETTLHVGPTLSWQENFSFNLDWGLGLQPEMHLLLHMEPKVYSSL
uniref:C2 domain-containing protein n=1 Tax=Eptatretus burgeri TaxID=7764 RepID=A0A8C4QGM8_EPTBU